ncbi:MAG: FMN-binding negative transcriptional regulator [Halioglobus sp.]|nr:FMN-binding negative transcriptional regulator [Halioglobus sp.]
MYIPKHFAMANTDEIHAFFEANAFGQLISYVDSRHFSTHMPFLMCRSESTVLGHLAMQNPQHYQLHGQQVLITLQGPHGYISPQWYCSSGVPTWNYQSVHVYGRASIFTDRERIERLVTGLTERYESALDEPWLPDYTESLLGAIVGVEVIIEEMQCKYKLSQNRSRRDRMQVIQQLRLRGDKSLARAMERNEKAKERVRYDG